MTVIATLDREDYEAVVDRMARTFDYAEVPDPEDDPEFWVAVDDEARAEARRLHAARVALFPTGWASA